MERLTRKSAVGEYLPSKHLNIRNEDTTSEQNLTDILDKLGKYEDFEECRMMILLPCKIGDTVYKICPINKSIHMGDMRNGKIVKSDCQRCPYGSCGCANIGFQKDADNVIREVTAYDEEWIFNRRNYFGEIYFTTKEEAERMLLSKLN